MSTCLFKRPSSFEGMSTLVGPKDNFASPLTRHPAMGRPVEVLIDSGADMSLMDVTLASELGLPTQPPSIPLDVRVLDGRSIGRVTHHTTPINLRVSGNHSEMIQFLLIESWDSLGSSDTIPHFTSLLVPFVSQMSPYSLYRSLLMNKALHRALWALVKSSALYRE